MMMMKRRIKVVDDRPVVGVGIVIYKRKKKDRRRRVKRRREEQRSKVKVGFVLAFEAILV